MFCNEGSDLTIIAAGISVAEALAAAEEMTGDGIHARVVDMASLKPIDVDMIVNCAAEIGAIVTAENHNIIGGLGSAVAEVLAEEGIGLPFKRIGVQDHFCEGGTTPYLLEKFGMGRAAITNAARA